MNKEQSQRLKGFAILMMLFLHLFNKMENVELCKTILTLNDTPLIYILAKCTANPVPIFIFISGYGMWLVNQKGDRKKYRRLLKLMLHYWIIMLIFVGIGHLIQPATYPGCIKIFLDNITTYKPTYNGEMWFLLPYLILAALSQKYFTLINKCHWLITLTTTFIMYHGQSYILSHHQDLTTEYYILTIVCNFLNILYYFTIGCLSAKYSVLEQLSNCIRNYLGGGSITSLQFVGYYAVSHN